MLEGNPIVVQGFEIPSDAILFLIILSIHILAGLTCVFSGLKAMLSKKAPGAHPKAGTVYFWSLFIVFTTMTIIVMMRWKEDHHLFILGFISFSSAHLGRIAKKNNWNKWSIYHITGMGISYLFLIIAFYIDNGRFLPVWKSLNPIFYWLLPALIGVPILIRTLIRNPFLRKSQQLQKKK